ncbi:sensor histidine kinase [Flindersiella endophytica]
MRSPFRALGPTMRVKLTLLFAALFLVACSLLTVFFYTAFENSFPTGKSSALTVLARNYPKAIERMTSEDFTAEQRNEFIKQAVTALDRQRDDALGSMLRQSGLAVGVIALAAIGAGWLLAGRALRPVQKITETARRVADRSLHERINLPGPRDEFKELADTFDAMLERLDKSFDSQRRFVANASHELRTPLAVNRTLLEVAGTTTDLSPEMRSVVNTLLATNDRSERLLDGLLVLARSENLSPQRREVDLSDIAAHAVEEVVAEAAKTGVVVDAEPEPAPTTGDPSLLERVAMNLVQNAVRHNVPGGTVMVTTGPAEEPGWVELRVRNTGPHVPPYEVDGLFEPFHRLGDARVSDGHGVGLGLSIVRSVVHTHGGRIQAVAQPAGGLDVTVGLPG